MIVRVFLVLSAIFIRSGLGIRWVLYAPLSTTGIPDIGVDNLIFSLHVSGVSSLLGSLNYIGTTKNCLRNSISPEHLSLFV